AVYYFREFHRRIRCMLTRFDDNGAARHQGRGYFSRQYENREVPRNDAAHHPDRFLIDQYILVWTVTRYYVPFHPPCPFRHVMEIVDCEIHFTACQFIILA